MAALVSDTNFTAINAGKFNNIVNDYNGKLFLKDLIQSLTSEISISSLKPNEGIQILHTHRENEEIYIIISGKGQFLIDDQVFPVKEGSIIRVGPSGKRCIRNTLNTEPLTYICIQGKQGSIEDTGLDDCDVPEEKPEWSIMRLAFTNVKNYY